MKLIENNRKVRAAGVDVKGMKKTPGHDGMVWSCSVYLDGAKIGGVQEDVNGAGLWVNISPESQAKFVSALKGVDYPINDLAFEDLGMTCPEDDTGYIEWVLPKIVNELMALKPLKKKCKTMTLYQLRTDEDAKYWFLSEPFTPELKEQLQSKYDVKLFLNEVLAEF